MNKGASIRLVVLLMGIVTMLAAFPTSGFGDVPQQFNFQGSLNDASGNPLDGAYRMEFSVYAGSSGGTALWSDDLSRMIEEKFAISIRLQYVRLRLELASPTFCERRKR